MYHLKDITIVLALGVILLGIGPANATTYCGHYVGYCGHYVGGPERIGAGTPRSQCKFSSLQECRASVRERGGGTCYRMGPVARATGR
jgi:hypothetical protein